MAEKLEKKVLSTALVSRIRKWHLLVPTPPLGKNPPGQSSKVEVQALDQLCVGGSSPGAADIWMYALMAKTDDNGCSHASAG
ncbi:GM15833 [Drosophila sechellia]|uniref:GM15833 n=1 Tax=Drosophila sechellia TaxID=7238 RepID=B4I7P7_DROSE|nr:GM15833 [Drosophila sechellia]